MKKLFNLIFFCGLGKDGYKRVSSSVREDNRKLLIVFSVLAALAFLVPVVLNIGKDSIGLRVMYISMLAFFVIMFMLGVAHVKKAQFLIDIFVVTYSALLLAGGVAIGILQSEQRTTLLLAFFIFSSVVFCSRIIYHVVFLTVAEVVYIILAKNTQATDVYTMNLINTLIFYFLGLFTSIFLMATKYKRYATEEKNKFLVEKDALTSVYNRRYYELDLERVKKSNDSMTICAFDINELKKINDNLGHDVGDDLIIGAARCIERVFGKYGTIYRIGGDEFVAIIRNEYESKEALLKEFNELTTTWRGTLIEGIQISCGIASWDGKDEEKLIEAIHEADFLMLEEKRRYYEQKGIDRRKY